MHKLHQNHSWLIKFAHTLLLIVLQSQIYRKETNYPTFNVHGSVHRKNILIHSYVQSDTTSHSLFYMETALHFFGWYHHPSSGAQTTVSTASGICHTVTATCHYRGRVGTGLSVLWVVAPPTAHSNQFQLLNDSSR